MRAAGLHVVTTYVEWSLHNPKDDVYDFTGIADIEQFIQLAQQEDLLVILRPGPYVWMQITSQILDFSNFT